MTKRIRAKHKIDRRLGENLWGRPGSPFNMRAYGPGIHGKRGKKLSPFGEQLRAKQKLKGYYGVLTEKQFRKYYKEADRRKGDTTENLIDILERLLIAVVYRMKFAPTPFGARQLISHGHILVNGQRVTIPSYVIKDGDVVSVKDKSKEIPMVLEASSSQERDIPEYIEVDHNKMSGSFLHTPKFEDVPYPVQMEPNLVIEYYSR